MTLATLKYISKLRKEIVWYCGTYDWKSTNKKEKKESLTEQSQNRWKWLIKKRKESHICERMLEELTDKKTKEERPKQNNGHTIEMEPEL